MIPVLPSAQVRAAMAAEDWDRAMALLQAHGEAVAAALESIDFSTAPHAPWLALLEEQQALTDEIRQARDEVERVLGKLASDQRGARAWSQALA